MTELSGPGTHFTLNGDVYMVVNPNTQCHEPEPSHYLTVSLTTGNIEQFAMSEMAGRTKIDTSFVQDEVCPVEIHDRLERQVPRYTAGHNENYAHRLNTLIAQYRGLHNELRSKVDLYADVPHRHVVMGLDQFLFIADRVQRLEEATFNLVNKIRPTLHPDYDESEGNSYEFMLDAVWNGAAALGGELKYSEAEGLAGMMAFPMTRLFKPDEPYLFVAAEVEPEI